MSIRSKIAWTALGCVLLSGAANGAEQGKPEPKKDHPTKSDKAPGRSGVAPDATTPAPGSAAVDPATSGEAVAASALRQIGCVTIPTPGGVQITVANPEDASTLPVGTVVWLKPNTDMTTMESLMRADGIAADTDRYLKLPSPLAPGAFYRPSYHPLSGWNGCAAAIGMATLAPATPYVE